MFGLVRSQEQPTILLIDDDLVSREVTATVLTLNGYMVQTVRDGTAALEFLATAEASPEVILVDAQMPGLSGPALITQLRARSRARIVAISGSNPPADVAAAADGFLLKPFEVEALEQVLDRRKSQSQVASILDPNAPVISLEVLAQLRQIMPEPAVRQIYFAIVSDLDQRAEALEAAIASGNAAEAGRIGHAIKGGCAMAGALQAARLGAMLESAALQPESNQLDNSTGLVDDLRAAARALERMLNPELPA